MIGSATMLLASGGTTEDTKETRSAKGSLFSSTAATGDYGDPRRFAALVSRYQARVHRLVAGILGPAYSADAEDATQEVFLLAYRKIDTFRGDSKVSTWLYRLAYNRAIDYRRRLDRRRDEALLPDEPVIRDGPATDPAPLGRALANERGANLRRHLDRLPAKQRTAVHLHYWLGCTVAEIAELMDSKSPTVKSHLFRARRSLARALAKDER